MESRFKTGEPVGTPLGRGVVREARTNGRVVVEVNGRAVVLQEDAVTPLESRQRSARRQKPARRSAAQAFGETRAPEPVPRVIARRTVDRPKRLSGVPAAEADLHGLTVEEALARAEQALNDALLADLPELRLIHGKSSGRIRAALHRRLREISTVRAFRLDPRNAGVTIVSL